MDGVAVHVLYVSHALEGNDSPGIENQEDGLETKTGFRLCMRQNKNRGADSFLQPQPVGSLIQFLRCEIRGGFIYSG